MLNDMLTASGVAPYDVAVVLHKSTLQPLRRLFPSLVFERQDLFEAYQAVHSSKAAATLRKRRFVASFVVFGADKMLFAGLFEVRNAQTRPTSEIYADSRYEELSQLYGATDTAPEVNIAARTHQTHFEMEPMAELDDLRGRLQIAVPPGRTYARLAENLYAPIVAITPRPITAPPPPNWNALVLRAAEIPALPGSWRQVLAQWRGIYLIVDERDGARYVGSAYGEDNLLGRWLVHVAGSVGVTVELAKRDPAHFRFSILELLSPAASDQDVITVENSWKDRLHTRAFGLNVN